MGLEDLHGVTVGWGHPRSLCGVSCVTLRCHCPPLGPIWWPWGMCGSHWRTWGCPMGLEGLCGVTVGWGHPRSLCGVSCVTLRCHCPLWVPFGGHGGCVGHTGGPARGPMGLEDLRGVAMGWGHPKSHCHLYGVSCVTLRCHCPHLGPIWWPWGMCGSHWRTWGCPMGVGGPSWCHRGLGTPQIPLSPLWGSGVTLRCPCPPLGPQNIEASQSAENSAFLPKIPLPNQKITFFF